MERKSLVNAWVKEAAKAGWRVERSKRHYRLYPVDKTHAPITLPKSMGHGRGMLNARADLRRAGLDVEL